MPICTMASIYALRQSMLTCDAPSRLAAKKRAQTAGDAPSRPAFRPTSPLKQATAPQAGELYGTISGFFAHIPVRRNPTCLEASASSPCWMLLHS
jgi:hypothetical protein